MGTGIYDWLFKNSQIKKKIDDYIIATGKTVSLREMIYYFFKQYNLSWNRFVKIEKNNFRKYEIAENYANINKLKKILIGFPNLNIGT